MVSERIGIIVNLEDTAATVSVVSSANGEDTFEIRVECDARSKVLGLGAWVILRGEGCVYWIDRQCDQFLPTEIRESRILLRTHLYFQQKGEDGYGQWVWSPALGRIAAICHKKYKPKQPYVALVARTADKYRDCIGYNWMLTKYIEEVSPGIPSNNAPCGASSRGNGDGASDSDGSLVGPFRSAVLDQQFADQVNDSNTSGIEIFRGVVALLNSGLVVVEPKGRIGFLQHNQCDVSNRILKVGDWVAVAALQRSGTRQYDVLDLPSIVRPEAQSRVQENAVMIIEGKRECIVWCSPRIGPNFNVYWEAVELVNSTAVSQDSGLSSRRKVRFKDKHKIHYIESEDTDVNNSSAVSACPLDQNSERLQEDTNTTSPESPERVEKSSNGISGERRVRSREDIYAVIRRVVSNGAVREAMNGYRPKELQSIDKALNLKFDH